MTFNSVRLPRLLLRLWLLLLLLLLLLPPLPSDTDTCAALTLLRGCCSWVWGAVVSVYDADHNVQRGRPVQDETATENSG